MPFEFGGEALEQAHFAYTYDKPIDEELKLMYRTFLLSLVTGVREELAQLDSQIEEKIERRLEPLTFDCDRSYPPSFRDFYEITSFEETPGRGYQTKSLKSLKKYSDETSAKFINGVLSQFVTDEA